MGWTVGQVAAMAGVTVRTLHHYAAVGLLAPAGRSAAGYRIYTDAELDRLRAILFYRELDFPLETIATLLGRTGPDTRPDLQDQRNLLTARIRRLQDMVTAIDKEMEAHHMGVRLTPQEKFEIFGPGYSPGYEQEAQERWGESEAWRQSQERTAAFDRSDWVSVKTRTEELNRRLAQAMSGGRTPARDEAMDLAEEHREQIGRFYDCSYPMHRALGDMYLADERFTRTYEDVAPGLARWVRDAIHANADRRDPGSASARQAAPAGG